MNTHYLKIIEQEVENSSYPDQPKELYEPIRYILGLGGKRVRPILCLMAAELFDFDPTSAQILKVAKAIEVFHNFSLVHDDIMDEAPLRRGMPTVHYKWNRDIAILSGDVMLVQAYEALVESENSQLVELIKQFNRSAILVCEGQQYDMNFERSLDVSIDDYLKMIELKTAELLGCSLRMGAIAAGSELNDANHLYDFGINLGLAFQIQDDYLDAFGESGKVGKQKGGDILANKKTFLLLNAIEAASAEDRKAILSSLELEGVQKVETVLQLFKKIGVDSFTKLKMDEYYQKALLSLEKVNVEEDKKVYLKALASSLMQRDH